MRPHARAIRQARLAKGLTQVQLAEALGVPQPTVSRWEIDMYRPSDTLRPLVAAILDLPESALV